MDYILIQQQLESLLDKNNDLISNLSNASALIKEMVDDISWVGFYLVRENHLILGPFQGKVACTKIAMNKGVCGTAVATKINQLVKDTHKFIGHIACDSGANSEIVINLYKNNEVIAVLDVDSYSFSRFDDNDLINFEIMANIIEKLF